jgi:ppGpp synthetase/RelA/SpoT-type nucleotidyltranferase
VKPFESFLLSCYRKSITALKKGENENIITPSNWYTKIPDIIRTSLVVKYLDGVEFTLKRICKLCEDFHLKHWHYHEARDEGYYAVHVYLKLSVEIPLMDWRTTKIEFNLELQVTTQLQDVIRKLTHKYYEERRTNVKGRDGKWQWNYDNDEFIANYLGHILHYVEGMIMEIRRRQEEGSSGKD